MGQMQHRVDLKIFVVNPKIFGCRIRHRLEATRRAFFNFAGLAEGVGLLNDTCWQDPALFTNPEN
jgi:hypothetical protein